MCTFDIACSGWGYLGRLEARTSQPGLDVDFEIGKRDSRATGWFTTFEALEVAVELEKDSDTHSTSSDATVLELRRALQARLSCLLSSTWLQ
jgi:hypothetical protein